MKLSQPELKLLCPCKDTSCNAELRITRAIGLIWVIAEADGQHVDLFLNRDQAIELRDWLADQILPGGIPSMNREEVVINPSHLGGSIEERQREEVERE